MRRMRTGSALALVVVATCLVHVPASQAVFPGSNGRIAWASSRDGNFEIYTAQSGGGELARLTTNPATDTDPAWSHDGTRIAFTSGRAGNDDIFIMAADGSGQTRLTNDPAADDNPAWSPGGRSLAFVSKRDGEAEIWVMNEDGSGQAQLTRNEVADAGPAWSPDGLRIAFWSARDGNPEIYSMRVDGSDPLRLTTNSGDDTSPNWSPDGSKLAWASNRDGNFEIYVMNADGSDVRRLTTNLEIDLDPTWSPDAQKIAFTSNRDGNYETYTMNADGTGQTRLTAAAGEDTTPDWQSVPIVPSPPPPVRDARLEPQWERSRYDGALIVSGEVPGPSRLRLVLRRGNAVYFTARVVLAAGSFRKSFDMPRGLLPGRYLLDVSAPGSPTSLAHQVLSLRLLAPPEGVVSRAWASYVVGGPALLRFPSTTTRVWAHFRFAAQPKGGRKLTATWYGAGRALPPDPKPKGRLVISVLYTKNDVPIPHGVWRCVLRAGTAVVQQVTLRIA